MSGQTILVIDDSPTILKVVQLVLAKAGFTVETAPDGEAGLEAAKKLKPDLILLDFVMPKMNGYQVCRELAQDKDLKDVAVILMSAKGDQVGERFVKVMGIVDYITKPFSPEAITAVVQHSIAKYGKRPPGEHTKPLLKASADDLERSRIDAAAAEADERYREQTLANLRSRISAVVAAPVAEHLRLAAAAGGDDAPPLDTIAELPALRELTIRDAHSDAVPPQLMSLGQLERLELLQYDFAGAALGVVRMGLPQTLVVE